jgi:hypothetical protein
MTPRMNWDDPEPRLEVCRIGLARYKCAAEVPVGERGSARQWFPVS